MAPKKNDPLYGYEGQPPEYTLANGNTLGAGDLVEQAAQRYHQANPGLDASQVPIAWNNLDDARRRDWCEDTVEHLNAQAQAAGAAADAVNVMDAVGGTAERELGAALIEAALTEVKALARPWQQMTADQQDEVIDRLHRQVRDAVGETVRLLSTKGAAHLVCELEQITVKKGAKAVLTIPQGGFGEDLVDAVGQHVILVLGHELKPEVPRPQADPDQGDLLTQVTGGSAPNISDDGNGSGEADTGGVVHSDPED